MNSHQNVQQLLEEAVLRPKLYAEANESAELSPVTPPAKSRGGASAAESPNTPDTAVKAGPVKTEVKRSAADAEYDRIMTNRQHCEALARMKTGIGSGHPWGENWVP